ncbi:MAG: M1 family metallopeptidase [Chitinophagaceae bacterium]
MRKISLFSLFIFCCLHYLTAQVNDISYMSSGGKLRPLQAIMDIRHYTLSLNVDIQKQSIDGFTIIDLVLSQQTDTLLFDLVHLLTVHSVAVDNRAGNFSRIGDSVFITGNGFKPGRHSIKINYGGNPPIAVRPPWQGGFTWTKDRSGNPWVVINCQLQGAKVYYPCKDHPSDEANEGADLYITVPKDLSVAGPGLLQGVQKAKNNRSTWHWKTNYTISNYCIVFNIGKYTVARRTYTTVAGNKVPMEYYVLQEDSAKATGILDMRERDTRVLEKYFGEYPWPKEKIGIAEVPNPGMEHQTMITYGGENFQYVHYPNLDYSPNLYHEFTHEWWANKVTNKDWAHMWIQEGITTYGEALFFKEIFGEDAYDSVMVRMRSRIQNKKPVVQGEGLNMTEVYNGDIYSKGAFFMHTLRYVLGDSVFFPTLKEFVTSEQYTYNNFVVTDDVLNLFNKRSSKDLKPLFNFFLYTTNILDFELQQRAPDTHYLSISNSPIPLPLDILTDTGIVHTTTPLAGKPFKIVSKTQPVIDPKGKYLKKVTIQ